MAARRETTERLGNMSALDPARGHLDDQRVKQQEIGIADQDDLHALLIAKILVQIERGVHPTKAGAQAQHPPAGRLGTTACGLEATAYLSQAQHGPSHHLQIRYDGGTAARPAAALFHKTDRV